MTTERHRWDRGVGRSAALLAILAAFWLPAAPAPAGHIGVHESGCTVVLAQPQVPIENVRPYVPARFTLREDSPGKTAVGPVIVHCDEVRVNGGPSRETSWVGFRVGLAGEPQGFEAAPIPPPGDPLLHLDDYQLFFASDNPELVDLFRLEAGVSDRQAVYVKHLDFDLDPETGAFSFDAPAPTPSPFRVVEARVGCVRVDDVVCQPTPPVGPIDLSVHHWGSGPHGVWRVGDPDGGPDRLPGLRIGPASGRILVDKGSQMARIFCDTDVAFDDPFAGSATFGPNVFAVSLADGPERPVEPTSNAGACG